MQRRSASTEPNGAPSVRPRTESAVATPAGPAGVGTDDDWETEGEDRTTIALPGDQDELVRRVAAANPRTIVVVKAGSPVAMPWLDDAAGGLTNVRGQVYLALWDAFKEQGITIPFPQRVVSHRGEPAAEVAGAGSTEQPSA